MKHLKRFLRGRRANGVWFVLGLISIGVIAVLALIEPQLKEIFQVVHDKLSPIA